MTKEDFYYKLHCIQQKQNENNDWPGALNQCIT